jgi:cell wall-associated NlpC family hydrolase
VGQQIVDFALQFQGYPYVYAGEGPYAFDCSGFTMFVINNTLGIGVPHDMAVQYQMGRSVSRDALQPGDLVFFQNTFRPGMSHDGIYIGGGQFIHAETESSGVTISDLNSDYYSSRWYGAVRFA